MGQMPSSAVRVCPGWGGNRRTSVTSSLSGSHLQIVKGDTVAGLAIITEACLDVKDRACVDVCPVQCIYEFDPVKNLLWSEQQAGSGVIENTHAPAPEAIAIFGDGILYVNLEEC